MKLNYLIFLLSFSFCSAQNLVKNPSFEEFKFCPENNSQFNNNVISWSLPNKGTSDYYNTCSTFLNDKNPHGYQNPQHGNGYAGIVVYYENIRNTLKDYREYIQGELKDTLSIFLAILRPTTFFLILTKCSTIYKNPCSPVL